MVVGLSGHKHCTCGRRSRHVSDGIALLHHHPKGPVKSKKKCKYTERVTTSTKQDTLDNLKRAVTVDHS